MRSIRVGKTTITTFQSNVRFDRINSIGINPESMAMSKVLTKQKLEISLELLDKIILETLNEESKNQLLEYKDITKKELDSVDIIAFSAKKSKLLSNEINEKIISLKIKLGEDRLDLFYLEIEKIIKPNSKLYNTYILNKSSLHRAESCSLQGTINSNEKELIINRNMLGLLNILDSIKEEDIIGR